MAAKKWPHPTGTDRMGWHNYYAKRFDKTGSVESAHLANWYQFLYLAFGNRQAK